MSLQFNSSSTSQDIVSMAEKLTSSDSVSFPIEDKVLYANQAMSLIWGWIYEAYGGWIYDDSNLTDLPEATTNLVSSQSFYALPAENAYLIGVSVKNSSGTWSKLIPLTLEHIQEGQSESEFLKNDSVPLYYRPTATGFKIYPPAQTSVTAGLKIYQSRDISSFTTADTTVTPGFSPLFHQAVPSYMAYKFAAVNHLTSKNDLEKEWLLYEPRIKKHYSQRYSELFPPRITVRDAVREFA